MKNFDFILNNSQIWIYYIKEIRFKIFYSFLTILITSLSCYLYINQLIYFLASYLLHNMNSQRFIFTKLTELFTTYLKFSLITGSIISIPFIIFSFWLFFIPGLYKYERNYLNYFIFFVIILFSLSWAVSYHFILPNILKFFLHFENDNVYFPVHLEAKLNDYLFPIFILLMNILICFQLPSILTLLLFFNVIDFEYLIKKRKYFYISFIFLSALISPPDIYNQFILTCLIIIVYELFIFILFFFYRFFSIS